MFKSFLKYQIYDINDYIAKQLSNTCENMFLVSFQKELLFLFLANSYYLIRDAAVELVEVNNVYLDLYLDT